MMDTSVPLALISLVTPKKSLTYFAHRPHSHSHIQPTHPPVSLVSLSANRRIILFVRPSLNYFSVCLCVCPKKTHPCTFTLVFFCKSNRGRRNKLVIVSYRIGIPHQNLTGRLQPIQTRLPHHNRKSTPKSVLICGNAHRICLSVEIKCFFYLLL